MITFQNYLTETYIWGIPTKLEDMSQEELQKAIDGHVFWIKHMSKYGSKTDNGYDDNRIQTMKEELKTMQRIQSKNE